MKPLEAMEAARIAHCGVPDRSGRPYIEHPMRVAAQVATEGHDDDAIVVAFLHDVWEDTELDVDKLARERGYEELTDRQARALAAMTRFYTDPDESYTAYIERVRHNRTATAVKLADLDDNLSPARADGITASLRQRYMATRLLLTNSKPKRSEITT